jgi:hypothetical protein
VRIHAMSEETIHFETARPRLLTGRAVVLIYCYGFLLAAPILASVLAVSLLKLGLLTLLPPLLAIALSVYLLPCGLGNPYAAKLVRALPGVEANLRSGFVVQLTLSPRIRRGLRADLEDADDFGYLSLGDSALVFRGDAVKLVVPFSQIERVEARSIGWRGLFLCGQRSVVTVRGLPDVRSMEFAERRSWVLPTSRRMGREIYDGLQSAIKASVSSRDQQTG